MVEKILRWFGWVPAEHLVHAVAERDAARRQMALALEEVEQYKKRIDFLENLRGTISDQNSELAEQLDDVTAKLAAAKKLTWV